MLALPLDTLLGAIGLRPDLAFLGAVALALTAKGFVRVDPETNETSVPGLFAGGDLVGDGPETIVRALGDGKRIARAIRARSTRGAAVRTAKAVPWPSAARVVRDRSVRVPGVRIPRRRAADRKGFEEVVGTLSPEAAEQEASRCLRCDLACGLCALVCPNRAIQSYEVDPFEVVLPTRVLDGGGLAPAGAARFRVGQRPQVAVLSTLCNECGNCATFCPTAGRPHADKPRLYLSREELEGEPDNAFMVCRDGDRFAILGRAEGETHELVLGEPLRYSSPAFTALLRPGTLEILEAQPRAGAAGPNGDRGLWTCATMYVLLQGFRRSLRHLPTAAWPA